MDWTKVMEQIDAHLSDEKVCRDVEGFLSEVQHRLTVDEEEFLLEPGTRVYVEEKMLVRNARYRGGGYFLVKAILDPLTEDGTPTSLSRSGTLKIMYDLEGHWVDDFYSRSTVV